MPTSDPLARSRAGNRPGAIHVRCDSRRSRRRAGSDGRFLRWISAIVLLADGVFAWHQQTAQLLPSGALCCICEEAVLVVSLCCPREVERTYTRARVSWLICSCAAFAARQERQHGLLCTVNWGSFRLRTPHAAQTRSDCSVVGSCWQRWIARRLSSEIHVDQ